MTNNNKKINWIRTVIVIVVGLFVCNLLLSFIIGVNAVDYTDVYIKYGTGMEKIEYSVTTQYVSNDEVTLNPSHGSANYDIEYYIISNYPYDEINLTVNAYSGQVAFVLHKITEYSGYNIFKCTGGYRYFNGYNITFGNNSIGEDIYLFECLVTGGANYNFYVEQIENEVKRLNAPKYVVQTIDIGYDEFDSLNYNMAITYPYEIYLNQQSRLLYIEGQVALTDGISKYIYTVNGGMPNDITNNFSGNSVTDEFITEVNSANFGITNYNINAYFNLGIVLMSYENETVSVTISAVGINGDLIDIITIPEVHVYNEIDESDTDTESDSETETNDPNVDYNLAYEQGYRDALSQMSKTPLYNATVNGTIVIEDNGSVTSTSKIEYKISNLTNKGGFALSNIKPLIDIVQENNPNSTVYLSELSITFDRQVVFTNDLVIFGTQSPILAINDTVNSEGYVSYYNPIITFKGKYDNGIYKNFDAFYFKYAPLDNIYGSESPFVYAMRISDTDWLGQLYKISFSDMIIDTNSQFLNSIIYIPYEAYIKLADAEAFGNINGWERGFEQGKQSPSNVSYQKGFEAGKLEINNAEYTRGYWDGVEAGDSLRNVILAPFDGISGVFHNMLNVNILGFQLDDIIGAILLMLMVIWIGKKVI